MLGTNADALRCSSVQNHGLLTGGSLHKGKYQCVQRLLITIVFCSWECSCHTTGETALSCELLCFLGGLHQRLSNRPLRWLSICEGLSWPLPVIKRLSRVKRRLEQSSVSFLYFAFPNSKPRLRLLPLFVSGRGCCTSALTSDKVVNLPRGACHSLHLIRLCTIICCSFRSITLCWS